MPQIAPIVLNDGTTETTFKPGISSAKSTVERWLNLPNGQMSVANSISQDLNLANNGDARAYVKLHHTLTEPAVEGQPLVPRGAIIYELNVRYDRSSTAAEREAADTQFRLLLEDVNSAKMRKDLESFS